MEYVSPIKPICEHSSASYREKMSWEIRKEDWKKENMLRLQLKTDILGTSHNSPLITKELHPRLTGLRI
jgi:hypothetical protein